MARFNLDDYETVEQRHARAIEQYPDLRCVIVNHTTPEDRSRNTWVVEARVYLNDVDQANNLPKACEWAFEVDGQGMANQTSALENACTSALGRALRWALGGSKGPSREEMMKVARGDKPKAEPKPVPDDFLEKVLKADNLTSLNELWHEAVAGGFSGALRDNFTSAKERLK